MVFKRIGLAITFSPSGKALLAEAARLKKLFDAEIVLIHIGAKTPENRSRLNNMITEAGLSIDSVKLIWEAGDAARTIIRKCDDENIDLLVAGALERETGLKYYIGSVARKIMREAPCSVLIMSSPTVDPKPFKKFCVSVDYTSESETAVRIAYKMALLENATDFILIREFQIPGLAITVSDSGSIEDAEENRLTWQKEEEEKLHIFVNELNLQELEVKCVCLFGKQGWEANKFIREINGDILVVPAPKRRMKFLDRIFQHDLEFILKQLPNSLLIIKSGN